MNLAKTLNEVRNVFFGKPRYCFEPFSKTSLLYPIDLGFTLEDERTFYSPKDENGIPLRRYASVGLQYNPTRVASYSLANYGRWKKEDSDTARENFIKGASWFLQGPDGLFHYNFSWDGMEPGWISSMAQGQSLSVLGRAYKEFGDECYREQGMRAVQPLTMTLSEGGLLSKIHGGFDFLEEYPLPEPRHTLNGFLYTLIGLSDLRHLDERLFQKVNPARFVETLEQVLPRYDLGFWSTYDLHVAPGGNRNPATFDYHCLHISQLAYLGHIFRSEKLLSFSERWAAYRDSKMNRCRALISKLKYRRLEKPQR